MSSRWAFSTLFGTATLIVLLISCSDDEAAGPCESQTLSNTVPAAAWATQRAQIASYRYAADLAAGVTTVELLDEGGQLLDTMKVWQSYGDATIADGAMVAELGGLRLVTRGFDLDARGYRLRAELSSADDPTLIVRARFDSGRCYPAPVDGAAAPPCAHDLPLADASFTLPSCGIVSDRYALADTPATLSHLDYAVPATEAIGAPTGGGFARTQTGGDLYTLAVRGPNGLVAAQEVKAWLAATGLDATVGSDRERRLTTAYLDRSWWREVEKHVGFCSYTDGETTGSTTQGIGVLRQAQSSCAGDQSASDWGGGGDNSSSNSSVWGDPHLTTHDGHKYDIQAAGEFVLMEASEGDPLRVHARFEPIANAKALEVCNNVTIATAVATELEGHRVSVHTRPRALFIDGEEIESLADLPTFSQGELAVERAWVSITWPGGERMEIVRGSALKITITLPPDRRGQLRGLLGDFNGDDGDDFRLRSGEALPTPLSFAAKHTTYADSWRVTPAESLLRYAAGEDTNTFTNRAIPGKAASLDDLPEAERSAAEARCAEEGITDPRALLDCALDVACAAEGDADELARAGLDANPKSSARPGDDALAAGGDALSVPAPASAEGEPPSPPPADSCQARARRWLRVFPEQAGQTLSAALDVDIVGPGSWQDPSTLPGGAIAAGSQIDSFLVHRDPDSADASPLSGWVKFARPIVGVIVDGAKLDSADGTLGAAGTTYPSGAARGVEEGDAIVIEGDGKTLRLQLFGQDVDQVRVLTEAN